MTLNRKLTAPVKTKNYKETSLMEYNNIEVKYEVVNYKSAKKFFKQIDKTIESRTENRFLVRELLPNNAKNLDQASKEALKKALKETQETEVSPQSVVFNLIKVTYTQEIGNLANKYGGKEQFNLKIIKRIQKLCKNTMFFGAYYNEDKNLIVITTIPIVEKDNGLTTRISFTKFNQKYSRYSVVKEMRELLKEQPFYDDFKAFKEYEKSNDSKLKKLIKAANDPKVTMGALGLLAKLLFDEHINQFITDQLQSNSVKYRKNRSILIECGYIILIRPNYENRHWSIKVR